MGEVGVGEGGGQNTPRAVGGKPEDLEELGMQGNQAEDGKVKEGKDDKGDTNAAEAGQVAVKGIDSHSPYKDKKRK